MLKRTPISYFGGKQNMIKYILPLIPNHIQYVEPFMGGGAVFFAKPKSTHEVINDVDGRLTNFYTVLKTQFDELHKLIISTAYSEIHYIRSKEILKTGIGTNVELAWALWVQCNMTFSNKIFGGFAFSNQGNGRGAKSTAKKRKEFYRYESRLEDVEIFSRNAIDLIKLKDNKDTFFYLDPPYVSSHQGHYAGYTMDDFIELLELLENLKGQFLLSSYPEIPLLEYRKNNDWNMLDIGGIVSVSKNKESQKDKTECLTWNYSKGLSLFD